MLGRRDKHSTDVTEALLVDVRRNVSGGVAAWQRSGLELPDNLDPHKPIAAICGSGQRSAVAASLLQRHGAQHVIHVVDGGVPHWIRHGWPATRRHNEAMTDQAKATIAVHAIQTGEVQIKLRQPSPRHERREARVLDVLLGRQWTPWLPISCYAIEHPEGVIVVDTGGDSHHSEPGFTPRWHVVASTCDRQSVTPDQEVGPQLRAFGHPPRSVAKVVMTHMHSDHAGGLSYFEGVEILMTEREAAMALGRTGAINAYFKQHYPKWFKPSTVALDRDPWETFDASIALTSDGAVRLLPTPGHTSGHMSVAIDRGDHVVLLTGDATYSEDLLLRGAIDGIAQDAKRHRDSTQRIRELCDRRQVIVVPTHDPRGAERLAKGQFTTIGAP